MYILLLALLLTSCSLGDPDLQDVTTVRVKLTDRDSIAAKAREYGYTSQANGFYHRASNTLWCPDEETVEAFRTCGHELRHAVKGDFHK